MALRSSGIVDQELPLTRFGKIRGSGVRWGGCAVNGAPLAERSTLFSQYGKWMTVSAVATIHARPSIWGASASIGRAVALCSRIVEERGRGAIRERDGPSIILRYLFSNFTSVIRKQPALSSLEQSLIPVHKVQLAPSKLDADNDFAQSGCEG